MVLDNAITERYQTHQEKIMTLYVTRKNQEFVVSNDLQLVDVELIRSSVELMGEPGFTGEGGYANGGYDVAGLSTDEPTGNKAYMSTVNGLYAINKTGTSTLYGTTGTNSITHLPHLNHGWVNVDIKGLTDGNQFLRDDGLEDNRLSLIVPTDHGLISVRSAQQNGPPTELRLERVKMEQRLRVNLHFAGTWPEDKRQARFVEDYADTVPATFRNTDGTVKTHGTTDCIIPSNMVVCAMLQFKIKPRTTL